MIRISIIIPTINEADNLISLISFFDSVIYGSNVEIIIADSPDTTDKTHLYVKKKYVTHIKTTGKGRAVQMNEAAKIAQGKILVFLHADVTPPVTFINDINDVVEAGSSFGFFSYRFEPSSLLLDINASFTRRDGLFSGGGDQIQFMTRDTFDSLAGYDENYCIMEDFDFIRRVRKAGIPFKVINKPAIVSSRKYKNNSWLKVNLLNLLAYIMFRLGISTTKIRNVYYGRLKPNTS